MQSVFSVGLVLEPCDKAGSGGAGGGGSGSERSDSLPPCDADVEGGSSISSHTSQVGGCSGNTHSLQPLMNN